MSSNSCSEEEEEEHSQASQEEEESGQTNIKSAKTTAESQPQIPKKQPLLIRNIINKGECSESEEESSEVESN